jgi:hypothetical protein
VLSQDGNDLARDGVVEAMDVAEGALEVLDRPAARGVDDLARMGNVFWPEVERVITWVGHGRDSNRPRRKDLIWIADRGGAPKCWCEHQLQYTDGTKKQHHKMWGYFSFGEDFRWTGNCWCVARNLGA